MRAHDRTGDELREEQHERRELDRPTSSPGSPCDRRRSCTTATGRCGTRCRPGRIRFSGSTSRLERRHARKKSAYLKNTRMPRFEHRLTIKQRLARRRILGALDPDAEVVVEDDRREQQREQVAIGPASPPPTRDRRATTRRTGSGRGRAVRPRFGRAPRRAPTPSTPSTTRCPCADQLARAPRRARPARQRQRDRGAEPPRARARSRARSSAGRASDAIHVRPAAPHDDRGPGQHRSPIAQRTSSHGGDSGIGRARASRTSAPPSGSHIASRSLATSRNTTSPSSDHAARAAPTTPGPRPSARARRGRTPRSGTAGSRAREQHQSALSKALRYDASGRTRRAAPRDSASAQSW